MCPSGRVGDGRHMDAIVPHVPLLKTSLARQSLTGSRRRSSQVASGPTAVKHAAERDPAELPRKVAPSLLPLLLFKDFRPSGLSDRRARGAVAPFVRSGFEDAAARTAEE